MASNKIDNSETHVVTPNPVVANQAEEYMKNPPNNLGLSDVREQDRSNDLVGVEGTEAVRDGEQSEAEKKRVQELADKLNA